MAPSDERRRAELVAALGSVRSRIAEACQGAGRDAQSVTMIAVTKTYPASDVAALAELGVTDVGESRDQQARAKVAELAGSPYPGLELRWHLIGRLQTNKARSVVSYAHAVHSVDRSELATALADAAARADRAHPLAVFIQVSLDGDPDRGGVIADGVAALAEWVATRSELALAGVMAVAPRAAEPDAAFTALREVSVQLQREHPQADAISAGMSADLEAAIRNGSTHVRVGTALLGRRPTVFG
ncbi:MAG: YggS family pyridoxal phosphate-dependent enzyme [Jatrophihabitantaceae bacterium]